MKVIYNAVAATAAVAAVVGVNVMGSNVWAEPTVMRGQDIEALLPTVILEGDQTRQIFSAAGATTYTVQGRDTYGSWRVDGDRYCSQWPPAREWSCYRVVHDGDAQTIIWLDGQGRETINRVIAK